MFRTNDDDDYDYCQKCTMGYSCDACKYWRGEYDSIVDKDRYPPPEWWIKEQSKKERKEKYWNEYSNFDNHSGQFIEEDPSCPCCGGEMIIRTNRIEKKKFFGCKKFPKCKGTKNAY